MIKTNLLKVLTLTTVLMGGILPTTMAYAYSESDVESKIESKIDKMNVSNKTDEDDFKKMIDKVIEKYDGYSVNIVAFDKDKATRENSGEITFELDITDSDGASHTKNVDVTIPKLQTYVYAKLPNMYGKYIQVTDSSITDKAVSGDLDDSKYSVSNKELDSDEVITGTGWQTINGGFYYIDPKTYETKKGWANIDDSLYHFDETTGEVKTGWDMYNGRYYFLNISTESKDAGKVLTGFKKIDNVNYYFTEKPVNDGNISTKQEILPNYGNMATGWQKISSDWYYFNINGSMQSDGWAKIDGQWYYFSKEGRMATNTTIDGYKIGANGTLQNK